MTTHGKPVRGEGGCWTRQDKYVDECGMESHYICHCANASDNSKLHITYPVGYDPTCSLCWLGFSHTEELHKASVKDNQSA